LHESQAPLHAPSQHTPSTQKPLPHWALRLQVLPLLCAAMHWPPPHQKPEAQLASTAQVVAHVAAPPQR
jgi:hypothetical protein